MDERRLSTADVLVSGILSISPPQTDIPTDRERVTIDEDDLSADELTQLVEQGMLIVASNYYGIPNLWKNGDVYRGVLLQYRAVTEDETFADVTDAIAWFREMFWATYG